MARLFVEPARIAGETVTLEGPEAHYLTRVMRLGPGDAVTVLDGSGWAYEARLERVEGGVVTASVVARYPAPEPPVPVTLYQALPKGEKWDLILQKATELGASAIVPVAAARSVVQFKGDKAESKAGRWRKIVQEAAEQCERGRIPEVGMPIGLDKLMLPAGMLGLVLSERVEGPSLPRALPEQPPGALGIFIGPEGGWAPAELERLRAMGVHEVSLGKRILRTETAGLAALAMVMAAYEL